MKTLDLGTTADGVQSFAHVDETTGAITVENRVDVDPLLDQNTRLANDWDGYSASREMRVLADIDMVTIQKWLVEENLDIFQFNKDPEVKRRVLRKLRDPDFRKLRCSSGKI